MEYVRNFFNNEEDRKNEYDSERNEKIEDDNDKSGQYEVIKIQKLGEDGEPNEDIILTEENKLQQLTREEIKDLKNINSSGKPIEKKKVLTLFEKALNSELYVTLTNMLQEGFTIPQLIEFTIGCIAAAISTEVIVLIIGYIVSESKERRS